MHALKSLNFDRMRGAVDGSDDARHDDEVEDDGSIFLIPIIA